MARNLLSNEVWFTLKFIIYHLKLITYVKKYESIDKHAISFDFIIHSLYLYSYLFIF